MQVHARAVDVSVDPWCLSNLVCPRDHQVLREVDSQLVCPAAHRYPVVDGVPVMLLGELDSYPIPELRLPAGDGRRLIDVGCSWGRWSIAAARKGYRVVGIDPSLGAIIAARRVSESLGLPIRYVVGDARYLPFSAE